MRSGAEGGWVTLLGLFTPAGSSAHAEHEPIDGGAGEVADHGQQAHALHVPHEVDFLETHDGHTRGRADDQGGTSGSCAIRKELPEDAVLDEESTPCVQRAGAATSYMPMEAATRGTLSTMAESRPMAMLIR